MEGRKPAGMQQWKLAAAVNATQRSRKWPKLTKIQCV